MSVYKDIHRRFQITHGATDNSCIIWKFSFATMNDGEFNPVAVDEDEF